MVESNNIEDDERAGFEAVEMSNMSATFDEEQVVSKRKPSLEERYLEIQSRTIEEEVSIEEEKKAPKVNGITSEGSSSSSEEIVKKKKKSKPSNELKMKDSSSDSDDPGDSSNDSIFDSSSDSDEERKSDGSGNSDD